MDDLELTSPEDLVRVYAPELAPHSSETRLAMHTSGVLVSLTLALLSFGPLEPSGPVALALLGVYVAAGAVIAEVAARRSHKKDVARFNKELRASPWRLYEAVAAKFLAEIERQRARTLGPGSDWGRARQPLEAAAQETARSVAYWQQRTAMDRSNEIAKQQLDTALRLRDKFQEALTELDSRAQVLVTFFNECEARLAVLQYAKRDYEEVNKLGALSERADDIVNDARATLASIGSSFLNEAIRVGNALGGIERVGWLSLADSVAVDKIETLADRILESSQHEREMLERLSKNVLP